MAIESVSVTPGTGKDIAVDTIAGKEFQVIKLALGAEDALDNVVDAGQQLSASSVPVVIASDQSAVPVSGPVTDAQLRATALPVSGPVTDAQLRATAVAIGQATHDSLNGNANLQVSNADVSISNPVPVVGLEDVLEVTLSLDTSAYGSGDVLADTQEIAGAFRTNGGHLTITSIVMQDQSDQGMGLDLVFLNAANSLGTENGAPSISDANGTAIVGIVPVGQADWIDLGGFRIATLLNMSLGPLEGVSTSLYVGAISRGTGTYAADALRLKISVVRD